jgi:hypothetical protein
MKIKFLQDVELEVVVDFDQVTDEPTYETVTFLQNDETDIDICDAAKAAGCTRNPIRQRLGCFRHPGILGCG